ncbi:hypothetical protein Y886_38435 [Xanthomonas hyacinthi DSM 19077]|nr:hypothetical protein Y886_38435 [Xanthomonas hyacinthi DSM 19077]
MAAGLACPGIGAAAGFVPGVAAGADVGTDWPMAADERNNRAERQEDRRCIEGSGRIAGATLMAATLARRM